MHPKTVAFICLGLAAAVLVSGGCVRRLIYPGTDLSSTELRSLGSDGWLVETLPVENVGLLNGLVKPPNASNGTWVLFFAGNAMSLADSRGVLAQLSGSNDWGLAVFAYRGYDGSSGSPSETALTQDALRIFEHLHSTQGVRPGRLFVVGQSLGTGIAVYMARSLSQEERSLRGVILISPYASMAEVVSDHAVIPIGGLISDTFRSEEWAKDVSSPALLIHGEDDTLIEPSHSERLATAWRGETEVVYVTGLGHGGLWAESAPTASIIQAFIQIKSTPKR